MYYYCQEWAHSIRYPVNESLRFAAFSKFDVNTFARNRQGAIAGDRLTLAPKGAFKPKYVNTEVNGDRLPPPPHTISIITLF